MHKRKNSIPSEASSPNRSPLRGLPDTHIIQDRYRSYHRAEDYIKHLNNIYNTQVVTAGIYDEAYFNSYKFRQQNPTENSKFKVSQFPKSKINPELLEQQEIINAFNHITLENRPRTRNRPKSTVPQTHHQSGTDRNSFSYKQVKIEACEKCKDCHKIACKCSKIIRDEFLDKMLKKQNKIKNRILDGSLYGSTRKSQVIVEQLKRKSFGPLRSNTYDEMTESCTSIRKKTVKLYFKSPLKKEEVSPDSHFAQSLSISPVNMSYRRDGKKK